MKKILLATAMLSATTGFAAAEVTVSGEGKMGIVYDGSLASDKAQFWSRVRVKFAMMGTTDGGLEFGAATRADQTGGNGNPFANGDSTVYISGAFGKLTMGDVGGAPDALVGQVSGVGYSGYLDGLQEIGFLGTDKTAVYYEYSSGALTFGVGAGQTSGANENMNVAVKYATDTFSVALGYEDSATDKQLSVLGSATFGAATVKAKIVDQDSVSDTMYALSADFAAGGGTYTIFYTDFGSVEHIGLGAAYDLGGGATVKAGLVDVGSDMVADVGVVMSF